MRMMLRFTRLLIITIALMGLLPIMPHRINAAGPRQWFVALRGPDRVVADHDYTYTVSLTNDGGTWPASVNARSVFRLAFDLTERYGEGTVGVSDIFVHPTGLQAADGTLPCAVHGGCWFTRVGAQVDFVFTKENVKIPPVVFDIVLHTASVFRPGDAFAVSATLQGDWAMPRAVSDAFPSPSVTDEPMSATIFAEYPLYCEAGGDAFHWPSDVEEGCARSSTTG